MKHTIKSFCLCLLVLSTVMFIQGQQNRAAAHEVPTLAPVEFTPRAADDIGMDAVVGEPVSLSVSVESPGDAPVSFYIWVHEGEYIKTMEPQLTITCDSPGAYFVRVFAVDSSAYTSEPSTPVNAAGLAEPVDVDGGPPPEITVFRAADPENDDSVYSAGDIFTIVFDRPTDRGGSGSERIGYDEIHSLFTFSVPICTDALGQWVNDTTFVITVYGLRSPPPLIGNVYAQPKAFPGIRLAGSLSVPSSSVSPPLSGNFGNPDAHADSDGDGVSDLEDNCPTIFNSDQFDSDRDGIGDACEETTDPRADSDLDGILDIEDNCPDTPNAEQRDSDRDGIGDACDNVLVEIVSLQAVPHNKKVRIHWRTAAEVDNAGFNIYRAEDPDGEYALLTDALIPAEGSPIQGATYTFVDTDVRNQQTYRYLLEDVDLDGLTEIHGPVRATPRLLYEFLSPE